MSGVSCSGHDDKKGKWVILGFASPEQTLGSPLSLTLAVEKVWSSKAHTDPFVSLFAVLHVRMGVSWVTMGVCPRQVPAQDPALWSLTTTVAHEPKKQPSTEPGILLRRSSNDSIRSKGGFWASSDLEYDQLNMKKCLIKLTWKSLEGSWKLKATTQHMAQQPLSTCYKHRTVTSEGCAALSFCQLSPWQQRDQPGSHHPHCHLMSRSMSLKGPNFTRGRQIGKN